MNKDEKTAQDFLKNYFHKLEYEPIKNEPPDFLGDSTVAIEVRRLNQHVLVDGVLVGIESEAFSLDRAIQKTFASFKATETSWFVTYTFHHPIPKAKTLNATLLSNLTEIHTSGIAFEFSIDNIKFQFHKASNLFDEAFLIAGGLDHNSGGWIQSELNDNTILVTKEKTEKISLNYSKYQKWWLVLVDHIDNCDTDPEIENNPAFIKSSSLFDEVYLISQDSKRHFKLK